MMREHFRFTSPFAQVLKTSNSKSKILNILLIILCLTFWYIANRDSADILLVLAVILWRGEETREGKATRSLVTGSVQAISESGGDPANPAGEVPPPEPEG
jgi:hypothetical protein